MSNNIWDDLLAEDSEKVTPSVLESKKEEKKEKKPKEKKLESKPTNLESKPNIPKNIPIQHKEIDPNKVLDINALWGVLCDLRDEFGVDALLALLTSKSVAGVKNFNAKKVNFNRTPAATSLITIFRELKKRGYF